MSPQPDLSEFEALTESAELRKLVSSLQERLYKAETKKADLVEAARVGFREAMIALGNPEAVPKPHRDRRDSGKPEVAILHLSDWQLGKATETYNSDVAVARIERLGDLVGQMVAIDRADHPVRDIHVLLGGDLTEGEEIFPGQRYEIDSDKFTQIGRATKTLVSLLRQQASVFEKVHLWQVEGNHGRQGKKGESPRDDNSDLFVYSQAQEWLLSSGVSNLVWHPRRSWYSVVEVGNYKALLVHGDQIKQFGGNTPAFGISRKVNAWVSGVLNATFTDCHMGHFHSPLVIPLANGKGRTFINPSVESDSAYAQEFMAASGTPGQRLNFVEPDRGRVTSERVLWLD